MLWQMQDGSTFDLRSSYHQVQVESSDMDKTASICPRGMYRFRTMPFGLCNAGATFQRLMDIVMSGLNMNVCLVYLDDIICYSATVEEHLERLNTILQRLRSSGLKLKPEKCSLFQKSVSFLGHTISDSGLGTDPKKVEVVSEWPTPSSVKDVRSFVGMASYYRRFIRDFAKIAAPLNDIARMNQRFHWSDEAQNAFEVLKRAMTSAPILGMPTDDDSYILDTDASDFAIGAVLSQIQNGEERVIAYASRSLDKRERNYCVTRRELLAVFHFLKYFKQYLLGRKCKVRTDHAALTWLRKTPDPIGQQARWLEQMEEYDFIVEHRAGIKHGNADALSRRSCMKTNCFCKDEIENAREVSNTSRPDDQFSNAANVADVSQNVNSRLQIDVSLTSNIEKCTENLETEYMFISSSGPADRCQNSLSTNKPVTRLPNFDQLCSGIEDVESDTNMNEHSTVKTVLSRSTRVEMTGSANAAEVKNEPDVEMSWSWNDMKLAQETDNEIGPIIKWLQEKSEQPGWEDVALKSSDTKTLWHMWPRLYLHDGVLRRRFVMIDGENDISQIVLPKVYREEFFRLAHGGMTGGHLGLTKTAMGIQLRAYWPTWKTDLTNYLRTCEPCARYHRGKIRRQAPLQTPYVGEPWERVSVDVTGPHPRSSKGRVYIITLVDHFSKWAEAIPVQNHTAPTIASVLMTHVFSRYGTPQQLLSDRGPEFQSELFTQLNKWLGIDKLRSSPYKPSTNANVERFHRTLNSMLGKVVKESQRDWDERLPLVMAAYRASVHSTTGYSPNRLFLGRETRMPLDLVMGVPKEDEGQPQSTDAYVQNLKEKTEAAYEIARRELRVAAERRKKTYDVRVKKTDFAVNDWVWYWYPRRYTKKSPKWQSMYTGPYLIVRVIEPVNFVLQKSSRSKPFVHMDKLKRCFGNTPQSWLNTGQSVEQATLSDPCDISNKNDSAREQSKLEVVTALPDDAVESDEPNSDIEVDRCERSKRTNRQRPGRFDDFVL